MKTLLITIFALTALAANATGSAAKQPNKMNSQQVCESLQSKIDDDCDHLMCDDFIANGTYQDLAECTSDEDYAEAAQGGCDGQPPLADFVKNYNKSHAQSKIKCD